ncbi:hypothetical protein [Chitinibacter sp. GC72]|uniref:hypothetical protein n=1 Tax=Chitinibacter sp. GC72 TaxID=1526917 RepID=UPI0018DF66B3|nr:hypothetical protein [Chitinibacter sp. GC72]
MSYTASIKLTAPTSLTEICAKIGKAFDPDTGGEYSFYAVYPVGHSGDTPLPAVQIQTQFYAVPEFAASLPYLLADPELLHASCELDYSRRWPELTAPTLTECQAFCAQTNLEVDDGHDHPV